MSNNQCVKCGVEMPKDAKWFEGTIGDFTEETREEWFVLNLKGIFSKDDVYIVCCGKHPEHKQKTEQV
jgi:hypothetical protein